MDDIARVLWAKTRDDGSYHPVLLHLLDVAAVSLALQDTMGSIAEVPRDWLAFFSAIHDVGKADPRFQAKDLAQAARLRGCDVRLPLPVTGFRHECVSADWVQDHLKRRLGWGGRAAAVIRSAIVGHHGVFHHTVDDEAETHPLRFATWKGYRDTLADVVSGTLGLLEWRVDAFEKASVVGVALSGHIVLADWIASNDELMPCGAADSSVDPATYFESKRRQAATCVERLCLRGKSVSEALCRPTLAFADVWPDLSKPRACQAAVDEAWAKGKLSPGLVLIEAPTGEGKTEAAVFLSEAWKATYGQRGAYLALPTAATSNQMFDRYSAFLATRGGGVSPRLIHGMAWLLDDIGPATPGSLRSSPDDDGAGGAALDWFKPSRRALLAPEAVGTIDQALMAVLKVRFGFLRLFGLSSRVLIVDEVHAYDVYMTRLLERLLAWCRALEVPVILLSATLSSEQRARLFRAYGASDEALSEVAASAYPLVAHVSLSSVVTVTAFAADPSRDRRVEVTLHRGALGDADALAALAVTQAAQGGCVAVVVNTVATAQRVFRSVRERAHPGTDVLLFHARFPAERRMEIEREVLRLFGRDASSRPKRSILVATQVVEQSLDLDFDVMLTEIAPVDLLLQRAGRVWRHPQAVRWGRTGPELHVAAPPEGQFDFAVTGRVYADEPLLRTLAALPEKGPIDAPADVRRLVETVYGRALLPGIPPEILEAARARRAKDEADDAQTALRFLIPAPQDRTYSLADDPRLPVDEAEPGETASYFRAQTRLGTDTVTVAFVEPAEAERLAAAPWLGRAESRALALRSVAIPKWWLGPGEGQAGGHPGLRSVRVAGRVVLLPTSEGRFVTRGREGMVVELVCDPVLGVSRNERGEACTASI